MKKIFLFISMALSLMTKAQETKYTISIDGGMCVPISNYSKNDYDKHLHYPSSISNGFASLGYNQKFDILYQFNKHFGVFINECFFKNNADTTIKYKQSLISYDGHDIGNNISNRSWQYIDFGIGPLINFPINKRFELQFKPSFGYCIITTPSLSGNTKYSWGEYKVSSESEKVNTMSYGIEGNLKYKLFKSVSIHLNCSYVRAKCEYSSPITYAIFDSNKPTEYFYDQVNYSIIVTVININLGIDYSF